MKEKKAHTVPATVFEEYRKGREFKSGLGDRGIYEQSRINERFYMGDQWHGVQCGDQKALVRYNIIKRIGDYKMAMAAGSSLVVCFSAEGVPNTLEMKERVRKQKELYRQANDDESVLNGTDKMTETEEINLVMGALSDYHKVTAERVKFDDLKCLALRRAYTTGTGILYTWWDPLIRTGLYADEGRTSPITGDIRCEVLDVENVYFGDPSYDDVQGQPYIIIAQRRRVDDLRREAHRNGRSPDEIERIQPDRDREYMAGEEDAEPTESCKATVLTKFYKKWNEDGTNYKICAVRVVEGAIVRDEWDTKLRLYPVAKMNWETSPNCAYGISEVTHLLSNQIAINRAVTAAANAVMMKGMPILVVNEDVVQVQVTNDPGQIIPVNAGEDLSQCLRYVAPDNFTPQFDNMVNSMIANTMTQAGANDAALGDMRPDNTSAIIAVREAATLPMQLLQNRFYSFVEDVARIWAEFWVNMYGARRLKVEDEQGEWYLPFDGDKYKDTIISARVDVGPASLWSEIQSRQTLDNLYTAQLLTPLQYLERLPKGSIPDQSGLLREARERVNMEQAQAAAPVAPPIAAPPDAGVTLPPTEDPAGAEGMPDPEMLVQMLSPEAREQFMNLTEEEKMQVLARVQGVS